MLLLSFSAWESRHPLFLKKEKQQQHLATIFNGHPSPSMSQYCLQSVLTFGTMITLSKYLNAENSSKFKNKDPPRCATRKSWW